MFVFLQLLSVCNRFICLYACCVLVIVGVHQQTVPMKTPEIFELTIADDSCESHSYEVADPPAARRPLRANWKLIVLQFDQCLKEISLEC